MPFRLKLSRHPLAIEFDAPTVADAISIMSQNGQELTELFGIAAGLTAAPEAAQVDEQPVAETAEAAAPATGKRRGRPAKNATAAPVDSAEAPPPAPIVANAPPPIPVPPVATQPAAPPDTTPNANGIPNFLDRTAPPPVPPAVAPPIVPPAAPAPGVLAQKVAADLKRRAAGSADGGKALVAWLASPQIALVVSSASFDEAIAVITMTTDEKLATVAGLLQIA